MKLQDEDDSDDSDDESGESDEETPKKVVWKTIWLHLQFFLLYEDRILINSSHIKAGSSKKRAPESTIKTPVPDKKAKVTPQRTGNSPAYACVLPYEYPFI